MNEVIAAFERNAREFWTVEDNILDNMQEAAAGWFERRHTGTQAALEAAQRMCQAPTPAQLFLEYQTWAMGAFERMMADAVACQDCSLTIGRLIGGPVVRAVEQGNGSVGAQQAGIVVPSAQETSTSPAPLEAPPPRKTSGVRASSAA